MSGFNPGVWTALVTPFKSSGAIDWKAYQALLEEQIISEVAGVIPSGTTGESPTLTLDEKKKLFSETVRYCKGTPTQVAAGTGSNNTAKTIELSKFASDVGVDGVLLVTPYYNKPSQAGCLEHFTAVADKVRCEVMLYNVPGRTVTGLHTATVAALAKHPRITAIKEATGNPAITSELRENIPAAKSGKFRIFSGDDGTFLPLLSIGAHGVVSVASNVFPREMVALYRAFKNGEAGKALLLHDRFFPMFRDLFVESNPGPVKFALNKLRRCSANMRLPLVPLSKEAQKTVISALKSSELL